MKKFLYVIVSSDGISHELWESWEQYHALDEVGDDDDDDIEREQALWSTRRTLPELLREGWKPVRETPLGGGREGAYALVLLERDD